VSIFDRLRGRTADPPDPAGAATATAAPGMLARVAALPRWALGILGFLMFAIAYWGVGGAIIADTNADLTQRPGFDLLPPGGSVAVATAALLIDDAVDDKGWTPNDGVLRPTALLEDMPAFQRGQHAVIAAFVAAVTEASDGDPELVDAAEALKTPPDRGWLHGDFPFIGGSAESRYSDAAEALARYNRALGDSGAAPGDARLLRLAVGALDRALVDSQIAIDAMVDEARGGADAQYHEVRGSAYAATMLLRGLRDDNGALIRERHLAGAWAEAIEALDTVATRSPFGVGRSDLVEQGYFLLRARDSLATLAGATTR
jgi:hypothetical protein